MKTKSTISLVINTKNEEENLKACINSAKSIVDEIVVVDMQSTDNTVDIAKKLGVRVYRINDSGYVEPARNFALSKATKDWILLLDADERLTSTLRRKIPALIDQGDYDGFYLPSKNYLLGKWIQHGMWWPDFKLKVFRKGSVHWSREIHSQPKLTGKSLTLEPQSDNAFIHNNIQNISGLMKMVSDHSSKEENLKKVNLTADELVQYLDKEFQWRYLEHKGYKDGLHGFILAKFMNVYRLLEFSNLWEKRGYVSNIAPIELYKVVEKNYSLELENKEIRKKLDEILDSKFYKLWLIYCKCKNLIRKKI